MIVNARMYSATPRLKAAWRRVLAWSLERARLDWNLTDYDAPAPLDALWARQDLGAVMMCGLPYSRRVPGATLVAAPVPSPERYGGKPVYFTDIAVRADSPHHRLEDTFGGVVGYTLENSMSGWAALRRYLLPYRETRGPRLYKSAVGGLVNGRRVIEALAAGEIDVGPLDSYYHDLLRQDEPATAQKVRVIATTPAAPIPPLVATAPLKAEEFARVRAALLEAGAAPALASERALLLLDRFAIPDEADYEVFREIDAAAGKHPGLW
jgi:ABC-type phosphate/phosphonate transport system substrate-binding protein